MDVRRYETVERKGHLLAILAALREFPNCVRFTFFDEIHSSAFGGWMFPQIRGCNHKFERRGRNRYTFSRKGRSDGCSSIWLLPLFYRHYIRQFFSPCERNGAFIMALLKWHYRQRGIYLSYLRSRGEKLQFGFFDCSDRSGWKSWNSTKQVAAHSPARFLRRVTILLRMPNWTLSLPRTLLISAR